MGSVILIGAITALMIAFNALYVAAEFATVSARKTSLRREAQAGGRLARMLVPIIDDPRRLDRYVATCQLGITASSLVLGYYGQAAIAGLLTPLFVGFGGAVAAQSISAIVVLVLLTIFQVVLGELVPKSVAVRYPERLAALTVVPLRWSMLLFHPFIVLFNGTGNLILRALGVPPSAGHAHVHSPDELQLLVAESAKGGLLEDDERELLTNAFQISEQSAADIMVPRTKLTAAPLTIPLLDLLRLAAREGYSRIPLYRESIDDIAGIVHIRDLYRLHVAGERSVTPALRQVPLVPESASASDVWNRLRQEGSYVAIVFDEYGGTAGMITVEDMIEEIFGDVEDEFDTEPMVMTRGADGRAQLAGDVPVDEANAAYSLGLPTDGPHTVGGLILDALGREPRAGDEVIVAGTRLRVEEVEGTVIRWISVLPAAATAGDEEAG
jgi:CBS domain containing-hemolysin-like protein